MLLLLGLAAAIVPPACTTTRSAADRGLWVGSLQLCATTVAEAVEAADIAGQPTLRITLTEDAAQELSLITARMIGKTLPIRIGDNVLLEPIVQERIAGGIVDISPLPEQQLERIRAAMEGPC
jgi:preprotein translocase subunit SecD